MESIGASGREVVDYPLGAAVDDRLCSAGFESCTQDQRRRLDCALGVWIQELRLVIIDAGHVELSGLRDRSYEAAIARVAWHEWGHALSVVRADEEDVAAGPILLTAAPPGIAGSVRAAGYRPREYTHEVVAEVYAVLMSRRRRGHVGQPRWLSDELYDLVRRVTGWSE